jgi:hypothetical protein
VKALAADLGLQCRFATFAVEQVKFNVRFVRFSATWSLLNLAAPAEVSVRSFKILALTVAAKGAFERVEISI